jgi:hypothetical protein
MDLEITTEKLRPSQVAVRNVESKLEITRNPNSNPTYNIHKHKNKISKFIDYRIDGH